MTDDEDFQVVTFVDRGRAVVMLCGDVDASVSATFRAAAHAAAEMARHVTFDVAGVTFMDASGLSVIVEVLRSSRPRHGNVLVRGARRPVLRIFEVTGFDNLVTMWDSDRLGPGVHRTCSRRPQRFARGFRACSARSG